MGDLGGEGVRIGRWEEGEGDEIGRWKGKEGSQAQNDHRRVFRKECVFDVG